MKLKIEFQSHLILNEHMKDNYMKILSEYYGTDIDREAHVYLDEKFFKVRMRNELGTYFVAFFKSQQEAENYAENYVLGETHAP